MFKNRRRGLVALLLAVALVAGIGGATRAFASEPAVVHGGTTVTTNPDGTFTATVTIKNSGLPGEVKVSALPCANVAELHVTPGSFVLDSGESGTVTITGRLIDPTKPGCFEVKLKWITDKPGWFDDGWRSSSTHVNVNPAPRRVQAAGGQQGGATLTPSPTPQPGGKR